MITYYAVIPCNINYIMKKNSIVTSIDKKGKKVLNCGLQLIHIKPSIEMTGSQFKILGERSYQHQKYGLNAIRFITISHMHNG